MVVMSIGGVDPSAGAGIFADIKVFQALNVYGTGVVTALTAQNPNNFFSIKPLDSNYIISQIDSILDIYPVKYIKTGMLYSKENIKIVSKKIQEYDFKAIIDPIMQSTSGGNLSQGDLSDCMKKHILKHAILTTPNIYEAEKLTGIKITDEKSAINASLKLGETCDNVITGGHLNGINIININGKITTKKHPIIQTTNLHGTGCNLTAAITSYLEKQNNLTQSITKSIQYTQKSIKNGKHKTLIPPNKIK